MSGTRGEGRLTSPKKERSLARAVIGGTGLIAFAGAINRLFSLLSAPILTVALGPEPYGVVALLGTVTSLGTLFALSGVDMSYSRYYFSESPSEGHAVERFCWRFSVAAALLVSLVCVLGWWSWSDKVGLSSSFAWVAGASIFLGALNAMATTRQRLREGYARIDRRLRGDGVHRSGIVDLPRPLFGGGTRGPSCSGDWPDCSSARWSPVCQRAPTWHGHPAWPRAGGWRCCGSGSPERRWRPCTG